MKTAQDQGTRALGQLRGGVAAGRQAYVVCPLVEGSEKLEAKAATEEHTRLAAEELRGLRLGLLHAHRPLRPWRRGHAVRPPRSVLRRVRRRQHLRCRDDAARANRAAT